MLVHSGGLIRISCGCAIRRTSIESDLVAIFRQWNKVDVVFLELLDEPQGCVAFG